jgi:glutathione S-transferase
MSRGASRRDLPTDQNKVDAVLTKAVPEMFGYLDAIAKQDYLVGSSFSIADISIVSNLVKHFGTRDAHDAFPIKHFAHPCFVQGYRRLRAQRAP